MATSAIANLRTELAADIVARLTTDGTTGVTVTEFPPGDDAGRTDVVFIGEIRTDQAHLSFGGSREERLEADIEVMTFKAGAGDTQAAAAEDRAVTILASIENAVRTDPTVSSSSFHAQVVRVTSRPDVDDQGRITHMTVTVEAEAHL